MADKYQDKYRVQSARLSSWDYRSNAAYFITICTLNREHYFGEITRRSMQLSEIGKKAKDNWLDIPNHFSFVMLDAFVIMPNHLHGIIVIDKPVAETLHATSLQPSESPSIKNKIMADISPKPGSLSTIIRSFKSSVTKWCNQNKIQFGWQSRFHDHITRNNNEFRRIQNYIINNPVNWKEDKFYK
jgi:putative transposase